VYRQTWMSDRWMMRNAPAPVVGPGQKCQPSHPTRIS